MYEGKNIHYSLVDNKPLCSFSQKQCNQRRLNGYGFCVRHILEDPNAPFRRCAYLAKSSQHLCTQAIPRGEDRLYCNNHMQVLGMLPRRERKPKKEKEKDKDHSNKDKDSIVTSLDPSKMTFGDRLKSKKLTVHKVAPPPLMGKILNPAEDPDDPYAFHDAAPEVSPVVTSLAQAGPAGMLPGGLSDLASRSPYPQSLPSPSQSRSTTGEGAGIGGMPKAKLYPELAEKLEKPRPSQETKTAKSRAKSSRTINKLQTKIAQNKIKDKLRKSQESNQAELSPNQVASPERMGLSASALLSPAIVGAEFGPVPGADMNPISATLMHPLALPDLRLPSMDSLRGRGMGARGLAGSTPDVLDMERLSQSKIPSQHHSLHPLPPPYPGLSVHRDQPFTPTPAADASRPAGQSSVVDMPVTTSLPSMTHLNPYLSFSQASSLSVPVVSPAQSQPHHLHLQRQSSSLHQGQSLPRRPPQPSPASKHSALPMDTADLPFSPQLSSVLSQSVASRTTHLNSANSAFPQTSAILTSKPAPPPLSGTLVTSKSAAVRSSLDLPPPPPYVPRTCTSSVPTSVSNSSSVLLTHVQRPKGVFTEKEAHLQLRNDDAVKLYGMYVRQKIYNHVFMNSTMNLCASDEESSDDEMMEEPLPFQRDWKVVSDDEEENDQEEDLRMVKLSVMRARYRRQFTQTKHASRTNTKSMATTRKFALALIRLAKQCPTTAARTLSAIYKKPLQWPQERKQRRKEIWRKVCQYKDGADKRCTVMCLPYTNHCRKHVMYNVDQQLFQFCTAKNSDNTQCCMPVIDIRHDFPLCYPHALQAEQQKKEEAAEVKKRPRKKTKPAALTRPPRKGKKKKGKNMRYQKPIPPDKPASNISLPEATPMQVTPSLPEPQPEVPPPPAATASPATSQPAVSVPPPPPLPAAAATTATTTIPSTCPEVVKEVVTPALSGGRSVGLVRDTKQQLEQALDLEETDFDKQLAELPLEQASRLLEDDAFDSFPEDAFNDIFSMADKNGESDLAQETEKLERELAEVNKVKDTLVKLINGSINIDEMGEQDKNQLAEMIATHLSGIPVDTVQPGAMSTTAAPVMDSYSGMTAEQAISDIALSLQSQQPLPAQPPITDFPAATGAGRGLAPQTLTSVASFVPSGVATTINGLSMPTALPQSSVAYNQALVASLAAGYTSSPAIQQQLSSVGLAGGHMYSEGPHAQHNYHVVQTATQSHGGQLTGFSGLQTLPSAAVLLSGGAGDLSAAQQLLARNLSRQQQVRLSTTASLPPQPTSSLPPQATTSLPSQVLSRQMDIAAGLNPQQGPASDTLHSQAGPSTGPQQLPRGLSVGGGVSALAQQGLSTSQLSSQLQAPPVLAAHLASSAHSTWVHAASVQQQAGHSPGLQQVGLAAALQQQAGLGASLQQQAGLSASLQQAGLSTGLQQVAHSSSLQQQSAHATALQQQTAHATALQQQSGHNPSLQQPAGLTTSLQQGRHSTSPQQQAGHVAPLQQQAALLQQGRHSTSPQQQAGHVAPLQQQAALLQQGRHSTSPQQQVTHGSGLQQTGHTASLPQGRHSTSPQQQIGQAALLLQTGHTASLPQGRHSTSPQQQVAHGSGLQQARHSPSLQQQIGHTTPLQQQAGHSASLQQARHSPSLQQQQAGHAANLQQAGLGTRHSPNLPQQQAGRVTPQAGLGTALQQQAGHSASLHQRSGRVTPLHKAGLAAGLQQTTGHTTTLQPQAGHSASLQQQTTHTASLQQQAGHAANLQQASHAANYHTVNGFPTTTQLSYTTSHALPSPSTARQTKIKGHPVQMNEAQQALHTGVGLANAMRMNATPSPPMTTLKQDPRIVALAQQGSRVVGRSGSPSLQGFGPGHSPSPPTHTPSPQAVTHTLPPFSPALSAYQGNSTGS